jgi:hypothetical protein
MRPCLETWVIADPLTASGWYTSLGAMEMTGYCEWTGRWEEEGT